jgi:hypothetical protein
MFVERRTRMDRMAALPTALDPVSTVPSLSLVPPLPAADLTAEEPQPVRPRVRRLVVFTGKIS